MTQKNKVLISKDDALPWSLNKQICMQASDCTISDCPPFTHEQVRGRDSGAVAQRVLLYSSPRSLVIDEWWRLTWMRWLFSTWVLLIHVGPLYFASLQSAAPQSIMRISSEQANGTSTDRREWQAEEENHWQVREPSMFLFVPGFFTYDQIRRTYTTCDEGLQALNSHKLLQVLLKILSFNGASISCCMLDSSLS